MKRKYPVLDMKRTGQNIKRIMQLRGITVKEVQEFLNLKTPQSVYHWFDGRNLPTIDNLYALSELFCISVDAFLVGDRVFKNREIETNECRRIMMYYKMMIFCE